MVVDASAVVAILLEEPDKGDYLVLLKKAQQPLTSVITKIEAALAVGREIQDYRLASTIVSEFFSKMRITTLGVMPETFDDVLAAYARYGKGTGHPARLNMGDCFSYALAKRSGLPLLYKGGDFPRTDIEAVLST